MARVLTPQGRRRAQAAPASSESAVLPPDLEQLAWLMDNSFRLPGGRRIGLDGLIGLIPGIGDVAGGIVSLYIVGRAWRLGAPRGTLARMALNVLLETVVGAIPVLGDLFDFAFKANQRNMSLLAKGLARTQLPR